MVSHLAMPPASTTLSQVVGQYAPVAAMDTNGNGVVERSEIGEDFRRYPRLGKESVSWLRCERGRCAQRR